MRACMRQVWPTHIEREVATEIVALRSHLTVSVNLERGFAISPCTCGVNTERMKSMTVTRKLADLAMNSEAMAL